MNNKICLITGATSGIGKATALGLAKKGATTIILGRNRKKCEKIVKEIIRSTGNSSMDYLTADLSSMGDVRKVCNEFKYRYDRLDVLINNAGARFVKRQLSIDGYEMTFALNYLAPFLLTNLLIESLKAGNMSRIINVSSSAHTSCKVFNFDDLNYEKNYDGKYAYAQSKLANILFTYELARRYKQSNISVNALHPGIVWSRFMQNNGLLKWSKHILYYILNREIVGPKKGAETSVYLASSSDLNGLSGQYFDNKKAIRSSDASYDEETAKRLWDESMQLTGL